MIQMYLNMEIVFLLQWLVKVVIIKFLYIRLGYLLLLFFMMLLICLCMGEYLWMLLGLVLIMLLCILRGSCEYLDSTRHQ